MTEALKPCPHCSSTRVTVIGIRDGQQAVCRECHASGPPTFHGRADMPNAYERAVTAWNARSEGHAPERPMGEVVEDVASAAYRAGYRDGYVDAVCPEGTDDEGEVHRSIDSTAMNDGWRNHRDQIIALTAPGGGGEGKDMASQGSAAAIRGPYPVLPANASNTGKEG